MWWNVFLIPALISLKQEDYSEFKDNLGYVASTKPARTTWQEPASNNIKIKNLRAQTHIKKKGRKERRNDNNKTLKIRSNLT